MAEPRVTTADMVERLRRHYIKPVPMAGGVFVPEVGVNGSMSGTAEGRTAGKTRRCDAVYVGFTSASGRLLVGHEVKVSRADWRHELDQPGKADAWADQCHAWYVVAPSTDIVRPEELPHGWGLLTINPRTRTRLDVTVGATVHADRDPAWWAVRSIVARLDTLSTADAHAEAQRLATAEVERRDRERQRNASTAVTTRDKLADQCADLLRELKGQNVFVRDADVVDGLRSLLLDRDAARQLNLIVADHVRSVQRLTTPFADAYGPLAALAAAIRKDTR